MMRKILGNNIKKIEFKDRNTLNQRLYWGYASTDEIKTKLDYISNRSIKDNMKEQKKKGRK